MDTGRGLTGFVLFTIIFVALYVLNSMPNVMMLNLALYESTLLTSQFAILGASVIGLGVIDYSKGCVLK